MWAITTRNHIYFRNYNEGSWNYVYSAKYAYQIDVNEQGVVWYQNLEGKAYRAVMPNGWSYAVPDYSDPFYYQYEDPTHIPWAKQVVSMGPDGDKSFAVEKESGVVWAQKSNKNKTLWYREKGHNNDGVVMKMISAGKDGRLWGTNNIFIGHTWTTVTYYKDTNDDMDNFNDWVRDTSMGCDKISATEDGRVCCIADDKKIYVSDKLGTWSKLEGKDRWDWTDNIHVTCASGGMLCAIDAPNDVYCDHDA